jgi:hypothetical protein
MLFRVIHQKKFNKAREFIIGRDFFENFNIINDNPLKKMHHSNSLNPMNAWWVLLIYNVVLF